MLCVASPLPQKYEENTSICLGNGRRCLAGHNHSLLYRRKWCELGQMERLWKTDHLFSGVPAGQETCQRTDRASSNLSLFMWCVSARRKQSGAGEALIDLPEAITTSNEQKIGRRRLAFSSVSRITWHQRTFTCQRARPVSEGKITTSQIRSVDH